MINGIEILGGGITHGILIVGMDTSVVIVGIDYLIIIFQIIEEMNQIKI